MANKKQQKRRQERRKTGGPGEVLSPVGDVDEPAEAAPSAHEAGGGANPERREQKDAVRKQKERQLRAIQRNAILKKVGIGVVIVAVVVGGIMMISNRRRAANSEVDGLLKQASAAAETAGCTEIETVEPYGATEEEDAAHVTQMPPLSTYKSIPPVSGPHDGATETAGVKSEAPPLGSVIHSMEHGAVAIWYRPGAQSGNEFRSIKNFVERNQDHVILAPYDYPDEGKEGELPAGKEMALSAWHHTQSCDSLSLPVVAKFLSEYRTPPLGGGEYLGDAPEQNALI